MKLRYGICLFSIFLLAAAAYYIGYQNLEQKEESKMEEEPDSQAGEAAASPEGLLQKNGAYIMEFYDQDTGQTETLTMELPAELEGKNRDEVLSYLEKQNESFKEQEEGFLTLALVSFSEKELIVKKTYSSLQKEYDFYLTVENGMVVIYKSDKKTLYRHTNMTLEEFPEDYREKIQEGCYIKDLTELYDLLENATS